MSIYFESKIDEYKKAYDMLKIAFDRQGISRILKLPFAFIVCALLIGSSTYIDDYKFFLANNAAVLHKLRIVEKHITQKKE